MLVLTYPKMGNSITTSNSISKKGKSAANTVRRWGWKYSEYTQKQLYEIYRNNVESTLNAGQECLLGRKWNSFNLDTVHYDFLRYLSGVAVSSRASTSREALDLGFMGMVVPPGITRKITVLEYFTRLMAQKHSEVPRKATDAAQSMARVEGTWMHEVEGILSQLEQKEEYKGISPSTTKAQEIERLLQSSKGMLVKQPRNLCRQKLDGGKYTLVLEIHAEISSNQQAE
jgi:hypothetical protein